MLGRKTPSPVLRVSAGAPRLPPPPAWPGFLLPLTPVLEAGSPGRVGCSDKPVVPSPWAEASFLDSGCQPLLPPWTQRQTPAPSAAQKERKETFMGGEGGVFLIKSNLKNTFFFFAYSHPTSPNLAVSCGQSRSALQALRA